jgi:hypothetical protein
LRHTIRLERVSKENCFTNPNADIKMSLSNEMPLYFDN